MIVRDPHTRRTVLFSLATLGVLAIILAIQFLGTPPSVSPRDAEQILRSDTSAVLLDVRTAGEANGGDGRIPGGRQIPVEELEERLAELSSFTGRTIIVYCRSGRRSRNAATLLVQHGFLAYNLDGGILSWIEEGLPVIKEPEVK